MTEAPLQRLGEYEVLAAISEGGMASVWLARPAARPNDLVALKVILAEHGKNKEFLAMLADEAAIASRLSHPNVLSTRGLGQDDKQRFLVMELLRGRTLLEVSKAAHARGKHLPYEVVAWIGARIADGLHYAHDLKDEHGQPMHVVHRDVNPSNVFITREGVPKLIDFGLAKARDRIASTAIGMVKGTLAYLAPEQAHGEAADPRTDIFALGVTLWETTLDRRLFHADSDVQTVRRVRDAKVPEPTTLVDDYPPALAEAITRALAVAPADRWQTAAQLRDALDAYVSSTGQKVDAASVRALSADLFADVEPAPWEVLADEAAADQARTRIWDARKEAEPVQPVEPVRPPVAPSVPSQAPPRPAARAPAVPSPRLVLIAGACAVLGALASGLAVRGCRGSADTKAIEQRVARIEDVLGMADAGPAPSGNAAVPANAQAPVSLDDRAESCAVAKVAAYRAWQEALARAKVNAAPAEAACADLWSDTKKQACYRFAMAQIHATQAARDAVIEGAAAAHETLKSVKDDAKNDAIARARAASQAAFAACDEASE